MPRRILVVEDDRLQSDIIARVLTADGHDVAVAYNGFDGARRLRGERFDVALVDYRMPEIDGLALARMVREAATLDLSPVLIALTASPGEVVDGEAEGDRVFDAIIGKPVDPRVLNQVIDRCFGMARPSADPDIFLRRLGG